MEDVRDSAEEGRNLVGIIPVAGHESFDFDQPWPDCMMPIAPNYNLIEAAVVECAWAGCKSIWIVVNGDFAPKPEHDTPAAASAAPTVLAAASLTGGGGGSSTASSESSA